MHLRPKVAWLQHMWWDDLTGEALLAEHYPWFLSTYQAYPKAVHRGGWLVLVLPSTHAASQQWRQAHGLCHVLRSELTPCKLM